MGLQWWEFYEVNHKVKNLRKQIAQLKEEVESLRKELNELKQQKKPHFWDRFTLR